jgi:hypothetical protein
VRQKYLSNKITAGVSSFVYPTVTINKFKDLKHLDELPDFSYMISMGGHCFLMADKQGKFSYSLKYSYEVVYKKGTGWTKRTYGKGQQNEKSSETDTIMLGPKKRGNYNNKKQPSR